MPTHTQKGRGIQVDFKDGIEVLTIYSAESSHEGYYQCVAYNGVGTASSVTYLDLPQGNDILWNEASI